LEETRASIDDVALCIQINMSTVSPTTIIARISGGNCGSCISLDMPDSPCRQPCIDAGGSGLGDLAGNLGCSSHRLNNRNRSK
jgi:hypothetical protein